jgi:hypothetical protein
MQIRVQNELNVTCAAFESGRPSFAKFSHVRPPAGSFPGGLYLRIAAKHPPYYSHDFYFSQEDRVRIGLFLLSGVPLPELALKHYPKSLAQTLGVVASSRDRRE